MSLCANTTLLLLLQYSTTDFPSLVLYGHCSKVPVFVVVEIVEFLAQLSNQSDSRVFSSGEKRRETDYSIILLTIIVSVQGSQDSAHKDTTHLHILLIHQSGELVYWTSCETDSHIAAT